MGVDDHMVVRVRIVYRNILSVNGKWQMSR